MPTFQLLGLPKYFSPWLMEMNFYGYPMVLAIASILLFIYQKREFSILMINYAGITLAISSCISITEIFSHYVATWFTGNIFAQFAFSNKALGHFALEYWLCILAISLSPQLLWFPKMRKNIWLAAAIAFFINSQSFIHYCYVYLSSLSFGFLPSSWAMERVYTYNDSFRPAIEGILYFIIILLVTIYKHYQWLSKKV